MAVFIRQINDYNVYVTAINVAQTIPFLLSLTTMKKFFIIVNLHIVNTHTQKIVPVAFLHSLLWKICVTFMQKEANIKRENILNFTVLKFFTKVQMEEQCSIRYYSHKLLSNH